MKKVVSYRKYMRSYAWKARRKRVLLRDPVCKVCGINSSCIVHHLHYANFGNENLEDLRGVCGPCHALVHDRDYIPKHARRRTSKKYKTLEEKYAAEAARLELRQARYKRFKAHKASVDAFWAGKPKPT